MKSLAELKAEAQLHLQQAMEECLKEGENILTSLILDALIEGEPYVECSKYSMEYEFVIRNLDELKTKGYRCENVCGSTRIYLD